MYHFPRRGQPRGVPDAARVPSDLPASADAAAAPAPATTGSPTLQSLGSLSSRSRSRLAKFHDQLFPNHRNAMRETQLHLAIKAGNLDRVEKLLRCGASPDFPVLATNQGAVQVKQGWNGKGYRTTLRFGEVIYSRPDFDRANHQPASPIAPSLQNQTPLQLAITHNSLKIFNVLLAHGADLNASSNGQSPLNTAIEHGQIEMAKELMRRGANTQRGHSDGISPLSMACKIDNVDLVQALLERDNTIEAGRQQRLNEALLQAAPIGSIPVMDVLIAAGAGFSVTDRLSETALHRAADKGHTDVVKKLLNLPQCPINARDEHGQTALGRAAQAGGHGATCAPDEAVYTALIAAGADLDAKDENGQTPLHLAVNSENTVAVEALIAAGARTDVENAKGQTALHLALGLQLPVPGRYDRTVQSVLAGLLGRIPAEPLRALDFPVREPFDLGRGDQVIGRGTSLKNEIFKAVIGASADVNALDRSGSTLLHHAIKEHNAVAVKALISAGARVDVKNATGQTALHLAAAWNINEPIFNAVAAMSRDVNAVDGQGKTALDLVMIDFNSTNLPNLALPSVARRLNRLIQGGVDIIKAGIDINKIDAQGRSLLHHAVFASRAGELLDVLLDAPGINVNQPDVQGNTPLDQAVKSHQLDTARKLAGHPDSDPACIFDAMVTQPTLADDLRQGLRQRAGIDINAAVDTESEVKMLTYCADFLPRLAPPNRKLTAHINYQLAKLLEQSGAVIDQPCGQGPEFRYTLALEQSLQSHQKLTAQAQDIATDLLLAAPSSQQFNIDGIALARSDIEDMAHARGPYAPPVPNQAALEADVGRVAHQGWGANVHGQGLLSRGQVSLALLQQRDRGQLSLEQAVKAGFALLDKKAKAAQLNSAPRVKIMRDGLNHLLQQTSEVNEGGLRTTAPETFRLLMSDIQARPALQESLEDALCLQLHDLGSDGGVCPTGCVQHLLETPYAIVPELMMVAADKPTIRDEVMKLLQRTCNWFDEELIQAVDIPGKEIEHAQLLKEQVKFKIDHFTATLDHATRRHQWPIETVEPLKVELLNGFREGLY